MARAYRDAPEAARALKAEGWRQRFTNRLAFDKKLDSGETLHALIYRAAGPGFAPPQEGDAVRVEVWSGG